MATTTKCDRCGEVVSGEARAMGWPIPSDDDAYVCPSCYGDEAFCAAGHVLPADSDHGVCRRCERRGGAVTA